jgi:hypothetical protein
MTGSNQPQTVGLIFVTGRDPGFITELCRDNGVPAPTMWWGDVGTTIAAVSTDRTACRPIEASGSGDRGAPGAMPEASRRRSRLDGHPGLPATDRFPLPRELRPGPGALRSLGL